MQPDQAEELRRRTKDFAIRVVNVYRSLPADGVARVIGNQLLRSGTAVGANYRAACRSRSDAEFAARIAVALEEAAESGYWFELLVDTGTITAAKLTGLRSECDEFVRIFAAARYTTKRRIQNQNSKLKIQNSPDDEA
jgi:four helix bundle protein